MKSKRRLSRIASSFLIGALSCVSLSTASGCIVIADGSGNWNEDVVKETRALSTEHAAGKPLNVRTHNGSVSVHKGGTDKVQITANIRARNQERLAQVEVKVERTSDGTLLIEPRFPQNAPKGSEGCSFEIMIPDVQGIQITTSNGAIEVEGLSGKAILATSNGKIALASHDGPAELDTSNGSIRTNGVKGDIDAETSNGSIAIVGGTGKVHADTSNGAIECEMAADAPGPVNLDTSNGSIVLTIGPGFSGEMSADTSNASVQLINVPGDANVNKSHASLKFKNAGAKSVLDTSNGSIKIKGAGTT